MSIAWSLVTATYCEAENIAEYTRAVAAALRPLGEPFEIVVVDDDSPDGTGRIVEETAANGIPELRLVTRRGERGIGSAYLRGIRESRGRVVTTTDADFSHPPEALAEILRAADAGSLALGSRFLRPGDFDTPFIRFAPTRTINFWHQHLLRTGVRDHTNGFIAARREHLDAMLAEGERIGIPPFDRILYGLILVVVAKRLGIPVREVPARYVFRTKGETKINFGRGVRLLLEEWLDSLRLFPHSLG